VLKLAAQLKLVRDIDDDDDDDDDDEEKGASTDEVAEQLEKSNVRTVGDLVKASASLVIRAVNASEAAVGNVAMYRAHSTPGRALDPTLPLADMQEWGAPINDELKKRRIVTVADVQDPLCLRVIDELREHPDHAELAEALAICREQLMRE
jgi:hypothetical protein